MEHKGSCMCGEIAYQFTGPIQATALCHCTDCQKWTGGAYTSNAVTTREGFTITKGTPKTCDIVGASGKINKHSFCSNCGSSLYTELEVMPGNVNIKAGTLDGGAASLGDKIDVEFYTSTRVNYLGPVAGAKQERKFPFGG